MSSSRCRPSTSCRRVYHERRIGEEGRQHPLDEHRERIAGWRQEGYSFLVIHKLLEGRGGGVLGDDSAPLHPPPLPGAGADR